MNYLIVGASAGLGRALSQKLASEGNNLILVATDDRDLHATALDLSTRYYVRVEILAADVAVDTGFLDELGKRVDSMGGIDGIFCPIGAVSPDDYIHDNPSVFNYITRVNYLSVVAVTTRFWNLLLHRPHKTVIVGFGSVSAIRGRNSNVGYAAAKRALSSFFESLRHAAVSTNILVQFYVLGYLETNMAFGKPTLLPKASTTVLARRVFSNLNTDIGVAFYPRYWLLVQFALRITPWSIFKHLVF